MKTEVLEETVYTKDARFLELEKYDLIAALNHVGNSISKKFNQNIFFGSGAYNLSLLKDALKYEIDDANFAITCYIDTGSDDLNDIAFYFEYGTGIFNTKGRSKMITPVHSKFMIFQESVGITKSGPSKKGNWVFTKAVEGVKPIFMFKKTIKWFEANSNFIEEKALRLVL